jgi:hypothetical protein
VGAVAWLVYGNKPTPIDADAGQAPAPPADAQPSSAGILPAPDADTGPKATPNALHDAAVPAPLPEAGHDAGLSGQHVRLVVGTSPTYSFEEMNRILGPHHKGLERCLANVHVPPKDPPLTFTLIIRRDGTVTKVTGRGERPPVPCMADQLATAVFPPLKPTQQVATAAVSITVGD